MDTHFLWLVLICIVSTLSHKKYSFEIHLYDIVIFLPIEIQPNCRNSQLNLCLYNHLNVSSVKLKKECVYGDFYAYMILDKCFMLLSNTADFVKELCKIFFIITSKNTYICCCAENGLEIMINTCRLPLLFPVFFNFLKPRKY